MSSVLLEYLPIEGGKCVGLVTLNRPTALNALSYEMLKKLSQTFRLLEEEQKVCAVILTGAGEAFSAGIDLTAASKVFKSDPKEREHEDVVLAMEKFKRPIIGCIHGAAITA
jgi:enoyl-CoA hydratase